VIGLVLRSAVFYWRPNLGVLLGTVLASAVLTGALLVGDSVDYSLKTFSMLRLGGIEHALDTRSQFIDQTLAERLDEALDGDVTAAMQLRGMAIYQSQDGSDRAQINQVQVYGVTDQFWSYGSGPPLELGEYDAAINQKLATALGVEAGEEISLRVAKPSLMARDSPLSWRDEERSRRGRYTVKRIVPDDEMGRFGLNPSQSAPYNAFVNRTFLQEQVEFAGLVNLILAGNGVTAEEITAALEDAWRIADVGLAFRAHDSGVVQLESERIFLSDETARAAQTLPGAQGTLTYLFTSIAKGEKLTPYSFAVAGPVPPDLKNDEIVINRWTAGEIGAAAGDEVKLTYSVLQPTNEFEEESRTFTVHSIREMDDLTLERELMPVFPGLSDVESCAEWDVGMPMDEELLNDPANEAYWDEYRQTPKVLVTLAAGEDMWRNRFGALTAVRFPDANGETAELETALRAELDPELLGLFFIPVGEQAAESAKSATDFGGLFLGMSFFLIIAALLLTGMLFVFGVQQRASQLGTLQALGFRPKTVRRLMLAEGMVIAAVGSIAGIFAATFYTKALIFGLTNYWGGAVANATILYHATPATMLTGAIATLICAGIAMWLVIRNLSKRTRAICCRSTSPRRPTTKRSKAPAAWQRPRRPSACFWPSPSSL
jgi:putative ABC transport system permease protein